MKSVTSSIALAALVAFGGLAFPCVCSDDPYLKLSEYLTKQIPDGSPGAEDLLTNVAAAHVLLSWVILEQDDNLKRLTETFLNLRDVENDYDLCDRRVLISLSILIETALDYHLKPNPSSKVERLNGLLIRLKAKVLSRCYEYLKPRWKLEKGEWDGGQLPGREFEYINEYVGNNKDLLKRLICRPKDTPISTNNQDAHALHQILYSAILEGADRLVLKRKNISQFYNYVHERLVERCKRLLGDAVASSYAMRLRFLLAIQRMNLPGDREYSEIDWEVHANIIGPLPLYMTCEWLSELTDDHYNILFVHFYYNLNPERRTDDSS